jgi:kynurenine formamidase
MNAVAYNDGHATLPSYQQLPRLEGLPCAWDVWPGDGQLLGCLNLLTPALTAAAASLVQHGTVFPLNWSLARPDPPLFGRPGLQHEVTGTVESTAHEDLLQNWNTQTSSQWDGLGHFKNHAARIAGYGDGFFAGMRVGEHSVERWARLGIAGRGVLADIGRWRLAEGRPIAVDVAERVPIDELMACLESQRTEVRQGDVLLVRFGWMEWYDGLDDDARSRVAKQPSAAGFDNGEETCEALWNLHIAAIGCDNPSVEAVPVGTKLTAAERAEVQADPRRLHEISAHAILLPMLGLPLGELFFLDDLAAHCASDGCYEFLFTSAPLALPGGVASPPNALAIK